MDQSIRKAENKAPNHPLAMLDHPLFPDVDKRCCRYDHPENIKQIKAHAAYSPYNGTVGHISGSQHNQYQGGYLDVSI